MSWKDVWTPAEAEYIVTSMAAHNRLPRADVEALLERANPHSTRERLLERQWVDRLASTSSQLLANLNIKAAVFYLSAPVWIYLHGTIADIWDRYKKCPTWLMWTSTSADPFDRAQREALHEFWGQLDGLRASFDEEERCAISLMRHVCCHPYQEKWVPKIKSKKIVDRVDSRSMDTKPSTTEAWAAFDAFLAKYGGEEKAAINIALRVWEPTASLLVALDAYHLASVQVAERDRLVRDLRVARAPKT
jgi:hypothetical protein